MKAPPEKLFKYVPSERRTILENLCIRFTPLKELNDPFECLPIFENFITKEYLEKLCRTAREAQYKKHVVDKALKGERVSMDLNQFIARQPTLIPYESKYVSALEREMNNNHSSSTFHKKHGVLSLTASENNLLMWAHYTKEHKGFLIEFDPSQSFFQLNDNPDGLEMGKLMEVKYSKLRPKFDMKVPLPSELKDSGFTIKSREWEYEKEWRIFQKIEDANDLSLTLFDIPSKCFKRIVIGLRMPDDERQKLCLIVRSNAGLRHVSIEKAVLAKDAFGLDYIPIDEPDPNLAITVLGEFWENGIKDKYY